MADEYFFGLTLDAENKEFKWEPDSLKENGDVSLTPQGEHCLLLKQAILVKGKPGETNIVQVETTGYKQNIVIPLVALEEGKLTHMALDLNFPDTPVVFKLIEGSGPVHFAGNHAVQVDQYAQGEDNFYSEEDADDDDVDEEEEEEEVAEEETKAKGKGKKRANSNSAPAPSKKKKGGKESA